MADASFRAAYVYLLGLYLGDGYLARSGRTWRLRVFMDSKYPGLVEECKRAVLSVRPNRRVGVYERRRDGCVEVSSYWNHWPCLIPQHGEGKKHERAIVLEAWQLEAVTMEAKNFVRGLIHSDGCRILAFDRGRESIRYHFKNRSEEILALYGFALDELKIPWTRPSTDQVAVYRKAACARMDEFVGPKY